MRFSGHTRVRALPALALLFLVLGWSSLPRTQVQQSGQSAASKVVSGTINGAAGGVLRNGDWSVKIPAGSFPGVGLVTVTVPDPAVRSCQLSIAPSALNSFRAPVTLSCRLQSQEEVRTFVMQSWDPGTRSWKASDSKTDSRALSCSASLPHFSTYRCGKAGT